MPDPNTDSDTRRHTVKECVAFHTLACFAKVVELEKTRIVFRQILIRVPVACVHALETAIARVTLPSRHVHRCVDFVRKLGFSSFLPSRVLLLTSLLAIGLDRSYLFIFISVLVFCARYRCIVLLALLFFLRLHLFVIVLHGLVFLFLFVFFLFFFVVVVVAFNDPRSLILFSCTMLLNLTWRRTWEGGRQVIFCHTCLAFRHLFLCRPCLLVGQRVRFILTHEVIGLIVLPSLQHGARDKHVI